MDPHDAALKGVAKTALGVAVVRAFESLRDDRLFDDPYAQKFVDATPDAFSGHPAAPGAVPSQFAAPAGDRAAEAEPAMLGAVFAFHAVLRTRFFDDYLLDATSVHCRQVVLLGAGLDTRALRLPWPGEVTVFELDLPEVFAFKEDVLDRCGAMPACGRRAVVPVDLRENWTDELVAAGFEPAAPAAWLAEGLLLYLTAGETAELLTAVGELSAPGSRIAFEHGGIAGSALLTRTRRLPAMEQYTSLWKGGLGEDAPDWLSRHGWRTQVHDPAELAASYGHPVPGQSGGGLLTAIRTAPC